MSVVVMVVDVVVVVMMVATYVFVEQMMMVLMYVHFDGGKLGTWVTKTRWFHAPQWI